MNLVRDLCGRSSRGVVSGVISDASDCVVVSVEVGADASMSDLVYGYSYNTPKLAVKAKVVPLNTMSTVGNAVMVEGIKVSTDVGVDRAKAGTGFGLTRIMCAAVGTGAL